DPPSRRGLLVRQPRAHPPGHARDRALRPAALGRARPAGQTGPGAAAPVRAGARPAAAPERIGCVSDAYAKAGVDQSAADAAVAGLVRALAAVKLGRPSAQVPLPGHYASVIRIDERTGIALSTDGVGTKLKIAEELGRFDTVGID